ncbi:LOG family protein [Planctomycetota bacterium]
MNPEPKTITLFGSGKAVSGDGLFELAFTVGQTVGQRGYTLANGGYGGTMLAAAQGAREAGGQVIGVTCKALGRSDPNAYVTEERVTEDLDERLVTLVQLGDAYGVLPGATGTLLELARVWEFANKGLMARPKPIVFIGEFWRPLVALMAAKDTDCMRHICQVQNAVAFGTLLSEKL